MLKMQPESDNSVSMKKSNAEKQIYHAAY